MGFDDRGVELGGGRAAGAQHDRRDAGGHADAQCHERCGTLVVHDVQIELGSGSEGEGERGRARTGGDDGVADPAV